MNNEMTGTIPSTIFNSNELSIVYLSGNRLTGQIPNNYVEAPLLKDLWLNSNELTGTIPNPSAEQLPLITEILLNNNKLSGDVPNGLCDLRATLANFDSLHADCFPPVGIDDPNNFCPLGCCTACLIGKQ
jgi:hypothetical protein